MKAEVRFAPQLQEYIVRLALEKGELSEFINPRDFAVMVEKMLAEKVASKIFEKIDFEKLLNDALR